MNFHGKKILQNQLNSVSLFIPTACTGARNNILLVICSSALKIEELIKFQWRNLSSTSKINDYWREKPPGLAPQMNETLKFKWKSIKDCLPGFLKFSSDATSPRYRPDVRLPKTDQPRRGCLKSTHPGRASILDWHDTAGFFKLSSKFILCVRKDNSKLNIGKCVRMHWAWI